MMNWLVKWGVRKYVLEIVNKALAAYNVNIDRARVIVKTASAKVKALLAFLDSLDAKLADGKLTDKVKALLAFLDSLDAKLADGKLTEQEADAITDEAVKLAKELTA